MAKNIYIGEIFRNDEIKNDYFLMKIILPQTFADPRPGQFVMIRIAGLNDPFLSRPISIYSFTRGDSSCTLELLFCVVGKGTQILAGLIKGSQVEIHGPLGGVFDIPDSKKNIVFIAGGIGIAPLSMLAEHLCRYSDTGKKALSFYLGARNSSSMVGLEKIKKLCYHLHVCTDDGSFGEKGLVTNYFKQNMDQYSPAETMVYACGPKAMIASLVQILKGTEFDCQVSLEERMACGVGACMGCAVSIKDKKGQLGYKRVCADGPVFNINNIVVE